MGFKLGIGGIGVLLGKGVLLPKVNGNVMVFGELRLGCLKGLGWGWDRCWFGVGLFRVSG